MDSRRTHVPFDPYYFDKQARQGTIYSPSETFDYIYRTNYWGSTDSVSGEGASRDQMHCYTVSMLRKNTAGEQPSVGRSETA